MANLKLAMWLSNGVLSLNNENIEQESISTPPFIFSVEKQIYSQFSRDLIVGVENDYQQERVNLHLENE